MFAQEGGGVSRLLSHQPFRELGNLSYAIYIVHAPVLAIFLDRVASALADRLGGGTVPFHGAGGETFPLLTFPAAWQGDLVLAGYVVVVVIAAWVVHKTVEVPARDWFNRRARGRPPHHPELAMAAGGAIPEDARRAPG